MCKKNNVKSIIEQGKKLSDNKIYFIKGFDDAIVGLGEHIELNYPVAIYDLNIMIDIIIKFNSSCNNSITRQDAFEILESIKHDIDTNVVEGNPIFIYNKI